MSVKWSLWDYMNLAVRKIVNAQDKKDNLETVRLMRETAARLYEEAAFIEEQHAIIEAQDLAALKESNPEDKES